LFFLNQNKIHNYSDEELMKMILKGHKLAFELLYERYFDKLVWFANGIIQDKFVAEDVVQEVFIKIIETPDRFDLDRKFSTWVYTLTSNLSKNKLRDEQLKQSKLNSIIQYNNQASKEHHNLDVRITEMKLEELFQNLSEKEKSLFTLRFEQQLSIKEIASTMQIPEGSVKSGLYYLLQKYDHLLKHFTHEY
jgi:RNA polymerase sigma-70 factor (ECF subfamily)